MSSEEIVKLLRRCMFSDTLLQIAADKIEELESETNRQKAEIERLNETLDNILRFLPACTDCEGKTPYGERTEKCVFETDLSYCGKKAYELFVKMRTELETAKSEARKEFAEKIKEKNGNDFLRSWYEGADECYEFNQEAFEAFINNLVKEMED